MTNCQYQFRREQNSRAPRDGALLQKLTKIALACAIQLFFLLFISSRALSRTPVASLSHVVGDVECRRRGAINWVSIGDGKDVFVGDLLFLKEGAAAELLYVNSGAAVHLSQQVLFRVTRDAPTHSRKINVFGMERGSVTASTALQLNPFERRRVRSAEDVSESGGKKAASNLRVLRNVSELMLAEPVNDSIFFVSKFPAKLCAKVAIPKANNSYWIFIWSEESNVTPMWSSSSAGEFSDILIDRPGKYEVQVFNENEVEVSRVMKVVYRKSDDTFSDLGSQLTEVKGSQTIFLE